jgi:hypothetical protein
MGHRWAKTGLALVRGAKRWVRRLDALGQDELVPAVMQGGEKAVHPYAYDAADAERLGDAA